MTFLPHPERRPAIITGASSGIGAATARLLAAAGHPVVLGARRLERCEDEAGAIRSAGGEALALRLDMSDAASVTAFVAAAIEAFGAIDIVVSNAGDVTPGTSIGTDPDAFAQDITVNFLGPQRLFNAVVPAMVDRGRGDVVLVSSSILRVPVPGMSAYATAKAGLDTLGRVMRMELEGTGVRVSTVRPGPTLTGMGMDWEPELVGSSITTWIERGLIHGQHYLTPDDVAGAIVLAATAPKGVHLALIEVEPEAPARGGGAERRREADEPNAEGAASYEQPKQGEGP